MDESTKRKMIKNYYTPFPSWSIWFLIIGGVLFLIGFKVIALLFIGLILAGIGGFVIYNYNKGLPTDKQIDEWLNEDIQIILKSKPLGKLGIDESQLVAESLAIPGPVFWVERGVDANEIVWKKGKDNYHRYSVWVLQLFVFTENFLGSYKCTYNSIRNAVVNESSNEFFYKDVVSVKTEEDSSNLTLKTGQAMVHAMAFQLNLSGDKVRVFINNNSAQISPEWTGKIDSAVQAIRTMIRQKKS